jgi:hypothetical protein
VVASNLVRSGQVARSLVNRQLQSLRNRFAQQKAEGRPPGFFNAANQIFRSQLVANRTASALAQQDVSVKLQNAVSLVGIAAQASANKLAKAASASLLILKVKEPGRVCGKAVSNQYIFIHSRDLALTAFS